MKPSLLKAERKQREWSQAEVAKALGVSIKTVRRWEQGQAVPHPYYRCKLSTLFGKTAEELGLLSYIDEDEATQPDRELYLPSDADANDAIQEVTLSIAQSKAPDVPTQASFLANPTIPQDLESVNDLRGRDGSFMRLDEWESRSPKYDLFSHQSLWGHMSGMSIFRPFNRLPWHHVPTPLKILLTLAIIITVLLAFILQPLYRSIHGGSPSSTSTMLTTDMETNFYGWTDNSPEGTEIADPTRHKSAGGVGTYSDPITFASSLDALSPGTIVYVPYLKKYFVMEDECDPCDSAWRNKHSYIIVIWIGGDANSSNSAQQSCEDSLSKPNVLVEVQPSSNKVVDTTPLFTDSGGCIKL